MSAIHGVLSGVITIVLMVVFLAIWYWAWRPRHRKTFKSLAELPLEDLTGSSEIPTGTGTTGSGPTGAGPTGAEPAATRRDAAARTGTERPDREPAPPRDRDGSTPQRRTLLRGRRMRRGHVGMGWQAGPQLEQSR